MAELDQDRDRAQTASGEELAALLHHHSSDVLLALLDNPALDETQLCLLLERKDLPAAVLEEIGRRKPLLKNYRVKRALAFHPRSPRLVSLRLLRDPINRPPSATSAGAENHPRAPRTRSHRGRAAGRRARAHSLRHPRQRQSYRSSDLKSFVAGKTSRGNHQSHLAASQMVVRIQRAPRAGASSRFAALHRARLPSRIDGVRFTRTRRAGNRP